MRQGIGEEHAHGLSAQLTRARAEARRQLDEPDPAGALRTVRKEVRPLGQKLREAAPETFAAHRDGLAVLLNDCALALVDTEPRPPAACAGVPRRNVPVSATTPASAGRAARIRMRTPQGFAPRPVVHRPVRMMKCYHMIFTRDSQRVISLPPVRRGANGVRRGEKRGALSCAGRDAATMGG